MNLALLNPFRRQLPDRIDSTLILPRSFHPPRPASTSSGAATTARRLDPVTSQSPVQESSSPPASSSKRKQKALRKRKKNSGNQNTSSQQEDQNDEWYSCFSVKFSHRGNYIIAGHGSGAVPYYDLTSRTLSSIFLPPHKDTMDQDSHLFSNGITSTSFSKRSRKVCIASFADDHICFIDNAHPFGTQDVVKGLSHDLLLKKGKSVKMEKEDDYVSEKYDASKKNDGVPMDINVKMQYERVRYITETKSWTECRGGNTMDHHQFNVWFQAIVMKLPSALGLCAEIHPMGSGALACLQDGSLVLMHIPVYAFYDGFHTDASHSDGYHTVLSQPGSEDSMGQVLPYHVTAATFDSTGRNIYAVTKCGKLLFLELDENYVRQMFPRADASTYENDDRDMDMDDVHSRKAFTTIVLSNLHFLELGGNASGSQVRLSRNDQLLLVNAKDTLKLYDVKECKNQEKLSKGQQKIQCEPRFSFQDVVSKSKWYACDFSGDGEYVVGGCNNEEAGDRYELYFWNTATGESRRSKDYTKVKKYRC